jgi:hypothetical protein
MAETLIDYLKDNDPRGFVARPIYSADGDFITIYLRDQDSYAERVDELLTVYLSVENHSLVGCKIKGVRRLLKTLGDFGVSISGKDISLNLLFLVGALFSPANRERYEEAGRYASDLTIPRETLDLQPA